MLIPAAGVGWRSRRSSATLPFVGFPAPLIDSAPTRTFRGPGLRDLEMLDAQVAFIGVPHDGGTALPDIATGQRAGPAQLCEATAAQF